jgi:DNA-binding HxlR family transcriptional regulator
VRGVTLDGLFHRRWSVPALAELHRTGGGGRFAPLAHRLSAHRVALRDSLDALIELGLLARNPGYGHPARPEYVLTAAGSAVAPHCDALLATLRRRGLVDRGLRKWPLPVLQAVGGGAARYGEVRRLLPFITDRSLAGALKELEQLGLVRRRVVREYPPVAEYEASPAAERILEPLDGMARSLRPKAG